MDKVEIAVGHYKALALGLRGICSGHPAGCPSVMPLVTAHVQLLQPGLALPCFPGKVQGLFSAVL